MNHSLAYVNANVIPMEGSARYSALLIENGLVSALGGDGEIAALCAQKGIVPRDAGGATILPAFFDATSMS